MNAGISNARALQTATSQSADAMGAGDQLGRLLPGYLADVLIVNGDPLTQIEDIRQTNTVIKSGFVVWSEGMDRVTINATTTDLIEHVH